MKTLQAYLLLLISLTPLFSGAQDMHFSQYTEHHALINPALTGANDNVRAVMGYRNQWRTAAGSAFKSYGASYEAKVLKGSWMQQTEVPKKYREQDIGRLGAGLSVYRNVAGEGDMGQTQLNLSTAAFIPVSHWSFLSAGIQAGYSWRRVDQTTMIFPNQYLPGGYDASLGSGETVPLNRYRYFDLSTGLMWAYGYQNRGFSFTRNTQARFGIATYHLTRPNLRVIGNAAENLKMRFVLHGDMTFTIKKSNYAVNPSFLAQLQGNQKEIIVGVLVKYFIANNHARYTNVVKNTAVSAGLNYRNKDAIAIQFLYESEEKYAFGLSYDLNISPLRKANHLRGGPELLIRLTPRKSVIEQKNKS